MKAVIHPEYFEKAKIVCACGAKYELGSTMPEIAVELCAACHPFYTGKQKIIDTARRVEKFGDKLTKKDTTAAAAKKAKQAARTANKKEKSAKKAS